MGCRATDTRHRCRHNPEGGPLPPGYQSWARRARGESAGCAAKCASKAGCRGEIRLSISMCVCVCVCKYSDWVPYQAKVAPMIRATPVRPKWAERGLAMDSMQMKTTLSEVETCLVSCVRARGCVSTDMHPVGRHMLPKWTHHAANGDRIELDPARGDRGVAIGLGGSGRGSGGCAVQTMGREERWDSSPRARNSGRQATWQPGGIAPLA